MKHQKITADPALSPVESCFAAIAEAPDDAANWTSLGDVLRGLNEREAALEAYENALARRGDDAATWFAKATLLTDMRRIDEASLAFRAVLHHQPSCHQAHSCLAAFLHVAGQDQQALAELGYALELAPDDARALLLLTRVHLRLGSYAVAEAAARKVLATQPNHAEAHGLLGRVLYDAARVSDALPVLERAVALAPGHAEARNDLAVALKSLGRLDEARAHLRDGLRLDPAMHGAYGNIAELVNFAEEPALAEQIATISAQLAADPRRPKGASDPLIPIYFAQAKALDDLGDHAGALQHYVAGGRLKRAALAYDEPAHVRFCDQVKHLFTREFLANNAHVGGPGAAPVFIIGMPRSGSTLVEQILASHPDVVGLGEVMFLPEAIKHCHQLYPALPPYPDLAPMLGPEHLQAMAKAYLDKVQVAGSARVTDKLLTNYFYAGLIHMIFPQAKFIHTRRDPVATCLSAFTTHFAEPMAYTYDFGELGRHYVRYAELMAHWDQALPPGVIHHVAYEDLVADTEAAARGMLTFLGLPWHDGCLEFHKAKRQVQTASLAQVRQPVYTAALNRWRRYGEGLAPLITALAPVLSGELVTAGS